MSVEKLGDMRVQFHTFRRVHAGRIQAAHVGIGPHPRTAMSKRVTAQKAMML